MVKILESMFDKHRGRQIINMQHMHSLHSQSMFLMLSDLGTSYGSPLGPTFCSNLSKWINLVNCDHHNRKIRYSCASEVGIIHLFLQIFKQPFVFKALDVLNQHLFLHPSSGHFRHRLQHPTISRTKNLLQ